MQQIKEGFECPKCKNKFTAKIVEVKEVINSQPKPVHVVDNKKNNYVKVNHTCPSCGNTEAYRHITTLSGDHAGITQERVLKRFKCTRCAYSWSES